MRLRIALTITLTVAGCTIAALAWRRVAPFPDGIVEHLPAETLAYAHVNLTLRVREHGARALDVYHTALGEELHQTIAVAMASREVRELGFAWFIPEGQLPFLALIIGQQRSATLDITPPATMTVGGQSIRVFVVRTTRSRTMRGSPVALRDALSAMRHRPLQLIVRPRAIAMLSESPLAPIARDLPTTVALAGVLDRHGVVFRSDGRLPIGRRVRVRLLDAPRAGTLQLHHIPIRATFAAIATPPAWRTPRTMLDPFLPEIADILIDPAIPGVAAQFTTPATPLSVPALRALAALLWPTTRPATLDGIPATLDVADPQMVDVLAVGPNRWEIMRSSGVRPPYDHVLAAVVKRAGRTILATTRSLADRVGRVGDDSSVLFLPPRCNMEFGGFPLAVWFVAPHPQRWISMSMDDHEKNVILCGLFVPAISIFGLREP